MTVSLEHAYLTVIVVLFFISVTLFAFLLYAWKSAIWYRARLERLKACTEGSMELSCNFLNDRIRVFLSAEPDAYEWSRQLIQHDIRRAEFMDRHADLFNARDHFSFWE